MSQTVKAAYLQEGEILDYTPTADVAAGFPVPVGGRVGVTRTPITANTLGSLLFTGIISARMAASAGNIGTIVWWDANGNPLNGTAGSGAFTTVAKDGDFAVGSLKVACATTDETASVELNVYPIDAPLFPGRIHELKSANYTIDAQDTGKVIHVDTDGVVITLPATATMAGVDVVIVNDGADGAVEISVDPDAADKLMGPDMAGADGQAVVNTKATAKRGDWIRVSGGQTDGCYIIAKRGIWA